MFGCGLWFVQSTRWRRSGSYLAVPMTLTLRAISKRVSERRTHVLAKHSLADRFNSALGTFMLHSGYLVVANSTGNGMFFAAASARVVSEIICFPVFSGSTRTTQIKR